MNEEGRRSWGITILHLLIINYTLRIAKKLNENTSRYSI